MYLQMIYRSRSVAPGRAVISEIVDASRRNNDFAGVTGYLIFDKAHFVQILEGEEETVENLFLRIAADHRHCEVVVLSRRDVAVRAFPDWAMGGATRSPEVQHIFNRHGLAQDGVGGMSADQVVSLARDIAGWEAERNMTRGLSGI